LSASVFLKSIFILSKRGCNLSYIYKESGEEGGRR